ncbi:MAG: restriction endonuclease subunit S [Syntrophomonas sp.]|nr:restriction endonuclease subunit S [Syntrophomonas sp.]
MVNKKQTLSISNEDLLEQALITADEQPYKIPDNWAWTSLKYIAKWGSGGTPSRKNPEYYYGDIPWIKTGELNNSYIYNTEEKITEEAIKKSSAKLFPINTVVIAMYGATIGKVGIMGVQSTTNQACACGVASAALNYLYLFYYALSQKDNFIELGKGGAQPNISQETIKAHICPLPPLAEQQRIIDRIESLFEKLDQAKELVQSALATFENRKAAILHKAFTGELTKKWREENGVVDNVVQHSKYSGDVPFPIPDQWEWVTLNDVAKYKKGPFGSSITKAMFVPKAENTYKVYEQGNAIRKTVNYGSYFIDENKYSELKGFVIVAGDIIVSCAGTVGETYRLPDDCEPGVINQALMRVRIFDNVEYEFFIYYFNEVLKMDIAGKSKGTAIKNIPPFAILKQMPFPLPSIPEQQAIDRIIYDLFEKEQQAKELYDVIDKIDLIKKAILARAFRGELGTNDPSEPSSIEFLKKVLAK